jgi:hypothetical protein
VRFEAEAVDFANIFHLTNDPKCGIILPSYNEGVWVEMLFHGQVTQRCEVCKRDNRPRAPDQRFCGPECRYEAKKREQRIARRYWVAEGRPPVGGADVDLRIGRKWASR